MSNILLSYISFDILLYFDRRQLNSIGEFTLAESRIPPSSIIRSIKKKNMHRHANFNCLFRQTIEMNLFPQRALVWSFWQIAMIKTEIPIKRKPWEFENFNNFNIMQVGNRVLLFKYNEKDHVPLEKNCRRKT